ncbi:MAG: hypothetical protein K2K27_07730 [Muribaculaceae bacterium]|nr:hypothetical protein [Muribaculaceae bacterium]
MKISSNSLFHFTSQLNFLEDILKKGFWPRYCKEYGWGNKFIDFAVPMVCFCDIPLSMIKDHTKFYGGYGIGVSRKWIYSHKSITPVQYIATSSFEFQYINRLLTHLKNATITDSGINKLLLAKKVSGKAIDKNGNISSKKFYDEREWRHVPSLSKDKIIIPLNKKEQFNPDEYSVITNTHRLVLDIDSIQYLIIPDESKRAKLIESLRNIYADQTKEKISILISKILTIKQILNDF